MQVTITDVEYCPILTETQKLVLSSLMPLCNLGVKTAYHKL